MTKKDNNQSLCHNCHRPSENPYKTTFLGENQFGSIATLSEDSLSAFILKHEKELGRTPITAN